MVIADHSFQAESCQNILVRLPADQGAICCVIEQRSIALAFGTADQKEGMSAFLTKRPPRFEGR